jgi:hypothetical protein
MILPTSVEPVKEMRLSCHRILLFIGSRLRIVNSLYACTISISKPLSAFAVYVILTIIGGCMSEPSLLDSLAERQLPDWKTVVWYVANETALEKSSF